MRIASVFASGLMIAMALPALAQNKPKIELLVDPSQQLSARLVEGLQDASLYTPTRWAVDGLDAMTWRGLPFADAWLPTAVLCGCAIVFLAIAVWRFRWEE